MPATHAADPASDVTRPSSSAVPGAAPIAAIDNIRAVLDRYVNHERSASFHRDLDRLQHAIEAAERLEYAEFETADEVLVPKDDFDALRDALAAVRAGHIKETA